MDELSHAFQGTDPKSFEIGRVLMAGAQTRGGIFLSQNDAALLQLAVQLIESFSLPVAPALKGAACDESCADPAHVRVINILEEYGGEDFLETREKGDMLILCNIARDPFTSADTNLSSYLRKSFTSSADHENKSKWAQKIAATDAKFVLVTNSDGFDLDEINDGSFVDISLAKGGKGLLARKSYLQDAETFLAVRNSPLLSLTGRRDEAAPLVYDISSRKMTPS